MYAIFNALIYTPLYNGLIFFVDIVPGHDVGLAVILLTLLVRFLLYPVARQAIRTQRAMRDAAPELESLKEKHKNNREEQARATLALYREKGINPFSTFFLVLLQIPVLIGLYWVFWKGGLPEVDPLLLYSFIPSPASVDMDFLGLISLRESSIVLSFLAGVSQFVHAQMTAVPPSKPTNGEPSFAHDFARSMHLQVRYVLPIMIGVFSYLVTAAVPLYFLTGNLFMIAQEYVTKKKVAVPVPSHGAQ